MKCGDVNKIVLLAILFSLTGDILVLITELSDQRCDKKKDLEDEKVKNDLNRTVDDLERRISRLEKIIS